MTHPEWVKQSARSWWLEDDGGEYGYSHQRDAYEDGFRRGWQQALLDAADHIDGKGLPDDMLAASLRVKAEDLA